MLTELPIPLVRADSVRAATEVYGVSLLVTVPLLLALLATVLLQGRSAGWRVLAQRAAIASGLVIATGHLLPWQWTAWVVPEGLAAPLVSLGRSQLRASSSLAWPTTNLLLAGYLTFAVLLLGVMVSGWLSARRLLRRSKPAAGVLHQLLETAQHQLGVERPVLLRQSAEVRSPVTWGWWRPVIVMPMEASSWRPAYQQAALWHEMEHVRCHDAAWALGARLLRALCWFHPLTWWLVRAYSRDRERACDERVLALGVRRSDYAELLGMVLGTAGEPAAPAIGLAMRTGLRERIRLIGAVTVRPYRLAPRGAACVVLAAALVSAPLGTVRISPTRQVLSSLMADQRWESRAYAVVRLAQRADTVALARQAAATDPSPAVRAWARFALSDGAALPPTLHNN